MYNLLIVDHKTRVKVEKQISVKRNRPILYASEDFLPAIIKKPHKLYNRNDIVVGLVVDGQAERLITWGWSTKFNRMINCFTIYYGGSRYLEKDGNRVLSSKKSGYLNVLDPIHLEEKQEFWKKLSTSTSRAEFIRELTELCGSNVPQWLGSANA